VEKLKNQSLLKTAFDTQAISIKGKEWLGGMQLVGEHGSGQEKWFFHLLDQTHKSAKGNPLKYDTWRIDQL